MELWQKQVVGVFLPFEGGILLITESPRRILLTILGIKLLIFGGILTALALA